MVFGTLQKKEISSVARLKQRPQINLTLNAEQKEYIRRKAYDLGRSGNAFIREKVFRNGWREELYNLRMNQPEDLSELDSRLK